MRDWIVFSSSSGETLQELWRRLPKNSQNHLRGVFFDRNCGALDVAKGMGVPVYSLNKADFEAETLKVLKNLNSNTLILLCGFYGILTKNFIESCEFPIVNTHPSLLPSFPGLDKKVQQKAAENVCVTGFSVHMVSEELDGGTLLFQHPVWVKPGAKWEESRQEVRLREQALLPKIWESLLHSDLKKEDLKLNCNELRARLSLNHKYFEDQKGL